jgi:hypothetical protein
MVSGWKKKMRGRNTASVAHNACRFVTDTVTHLQCFLPLATHDTPCLSTKMESSPHARRVSCSGCLWTVCTEIIPRCKWQGRFSISSKMTPHHVRCCNCCKLSPLVLCLHAPPLTRRSRCFVMPILKEEIVEKCFACECAFFFINFFEKSSFFCCSTFHAWRSSCAAGTSYIYVLTQHRTGSMSGVSP